jgi:radical SAM protein with 4Fe4S-binding SPASM domain
MQFSFAGEPLMNPRLPEMIAMATCEGIVCKVDTNGMFLEHYAEGLVDAGLQRLNVALNGINQAMLATYRKNADFDKIVRGVKKIIAYRDTHHKKFPKVHMQFLVTKYNENSLDEAKVLARQIGFDAIEFKSLNVCLGDWILVEKRQILASEFLPQNKKFLRYQKKNDMWVFDEKLNKFCADIFSSAVVLWNGDLALCCMDFEGTYILGNVVQQAFLDIWRNDRARNYRKYILRKKLPLCKNCALTVGHIERHQLKEEKHACL